MNEIDKKNTIYVSIILVVLLITCAFSFTFAFIGKATGNGTILINGNVLDASNAIKLTYSGDTDLSLNITLDELSILEGTNDYSSFIESDVATVNVTLTTDPSFYPNGVECKYSAEYVANNSNGMYTSSAESKNNSLNELTILRANSTGQYTEKVLATSNNNTTNIFDNYSISTSSSSSTATIPWTFKLRFYNLGVDQSDVIGQTPAGTIKIIPGECEKL